LGLKRMKLPVFMKTIRFRLTVAYTLLFLLLILVLVGGINIAIGRNGMDFQGPDPHNPVDFELWIQTHQGDISQILEHLRIYSMIGFIAVVVIGVICVYFLSGRMLKPVDKVSTLAGRISYTNLKERLNYKGPNDEIKRLSDTFDDMLSRLETAVESQKQFMQDASHELRTPIATAITNIEVLEMDKKATMVDYQTLIKILKLSLDRMSNISNGLLILAEGAPLKSNRSKIDLGSLISEVVNETRTRAASENMKIHWTKPPGEIAMLGDSIHIKQVIFNLVDNAIKYNRPEGSIKIELSAENKSIRIVVADTGIGVSAMDLPKIFDRFFRVDKSRSRKSGGSGLGLAIVKKIVEDHFGTISVKSIPGQGSSFCLIFPGYPNS
jgi:two-component system, OmpR family, sensor histidine kinase ArlS